MSDETAPTNRWIYARRIAAGELQGAPAGCQVCNNPIPNGPVYLLHLGQTVLTTCDPCLVEAAQAAAHPGPTPALTTPLVPFRPR